MGMVKCTTSILCLLDVDLTIQYAICKFSINSANSVVFESKCLKLSYKVFGCNFFAISRTIEYGNDIIATMARLFPSHNYTFYSRISHGIFKLRIQKPNHHYSIGFIFVGHSYSFIILLCAICKFVSNHLLPL